MEAMEVMEATQHAITTWPQSESAFNGYHDNFCYVCGDTMELFNCKTCSTSYHASCMSPTMDPDEVPPFWYCPHCIDRDLHIPQPASPQSALVNPLMDGNQQYPSPNSIEATQSQTVSVVGLDNIIPFIPPIQQPSNITTKDTTPLSRKQNLKTIDITQASLVSHSKPNSVPKTTTKHTKPSSSPPRKRSKYSNLSSDVDKALVVIQRELEKAAKVGKAEEVLQDRIVELEQQVKLKDGRIRLVERELEVVRAGGGEVGELKRELEIVKERNRVLEEEVRGKDGELRDWKERLKGLLGGEAGLG